jgi:uncharacterized membrane protein
MLGHHRAVGTFATAHEAEVALRELKASGFPMDRVSLIGRENASLTDRGQQLAQDTEVTDKAKAGAVAGGTIGGLTGLLVGLGAFAIPGIGPVMAGGAFATALATTATGGAIGAATGGVIGSLVGLGIPEDRARTYSDRVSRGEYLVMVEGSEAEIHQAEQILSQRGVHDWGVFAAPGTGVATASGAPAGTLYPSDAPVAPAAPPAGTLYPEDLQSTNPAAAQTAAPAGTLYPSGEAAPRTGNSFPAGTLYPEGTPEEDQVGKVHDPLK